MTQAYGQSGSPRRRGVALIGAVAGAALVVLLLTGVRLGNAPTELARLDSAPASAHAALQPAAGLDAGVDWSRVESAPDDAGVSVAAYER
jgi:hypothetical protein